MANDQDQTFSDGNEAERTEADAAASPQDLLKKAETAAQEHYDAWLRAKAEGDNIRKRAQLDVVNAHKYAVENFAAELLPIKDALETALAIQSATPDALKSGVDLTLKQFNAAFDKFNLVEINPVGQKFDPHRHQAISSVEAETVGLEPNTVAQVFQKGYLLNDRVLRPALVAVAKPKAVENT